MESVISRENANANAGSTESVNRNPDRYVVAKAMPLVTSIN